MPKNFKTDQERREYARKIYDKYKNNEEFKTKRQNRVNKSRNKNRNKYNETQRIYYNNLSVEEKILKRSKIRARQLRLDHSITLEDIIIPKKCPILNIDIIVDNKISSKYSPSIDRIDNNKGYIKGNVKIISNLANSIKRNLTIKEIENLFKYIKSSA